jgi:hypothetical protein
LYLVGAERLQGRDAGNEHGRDGDQAAAAGDGIDKTGEETGCGEEEKQMGGKV